MSCSSLFCLSTAISEALALFYKKIKISFILMKRLNLFLIVNPNFLLIQRHYPCNKVNAACGR